MTEQFDNTHPVIPHLVVAGANDAIAFYEKAFGAVEEIRLPGPDGRLVHACVNINGGRVLLVDEMPEMGLLGPAARGGTPVSIHLTVPDADAVVAQAVAAGAKVTLEVADQFWGDRYGEVEDPFGHRWSVATPGKDAPRTSEGLAKAMESAPPI